MKIAIVDDERPARRELIFLLSSILKEAEFLEADSAEEACRLMETQRINAFFLDVNLGEVKGTTLASMIREKYPAAGIVFVTAYQDYAVEAFELEAVDYVMKPFELKRLEKAVEKLKSKGCMDDEREERRESVIQDKIAVNGGDRLILIPVDDIVLVEANQRYCTIYTKDKTYEETITMNHLEGKLKKWGFYRVHKSYLVNLKYVEELLPGYHNGYAMRMKFYKGQPIPISRSQVKNIRDLYTLS